jgi:uncharacterized membrane protein SpoIIM required for sporulation
MKESKFVEQNKKNWLEFETDLRLENNKTKHSRLFIQVTDDLSYARTFYKYRSVRVYLNGIAQLLFNNLYQNQSSSFKSFIKFWQYDLPFQIREARREFTISFLIFLLSFGIGILSSIYDKDFARFILGNDYVQMTIENIKNNDPLAVYKKGNEAEAFLGITINNLFVALYTFVLGAFMSVGTFLALLRNGIMVGVFQYFFIERGLFRESFLTIWQHGTIEISCIIIAGAAGLTLGKGLIFPGTYSRITSFKISALRGLKIFTGIVPLIIMAGFIESFITRHTNVGDGIRIMVILLSLTFILFYFVWYPRYLSKRGKYAEKRAEKVSYTEKTEYDFRRIQSADEILGNSFKYFNQNLLVFILTVLGIALFHSFASVAFSSYQQKNEFGIATGSFISFFQLQSIKAHFWLGILTLSFLQVYLCRSISKAINKNDAKSGLIALMAGSLVSSFVILLPFGLGISWGVISLMFVGPVLFLAVYKGYQEKTFLVNALPGTFSLITNSWRNLFWNSIKIFGFIIVLYVLMNTDVVKNYLESIFINFKYDTTTTQLLEVFALTLITVILMGVYLYFLITTSVFSYYAFREITLAEGLMKRIEVFGERNSLFGFEKEKR